jgi:K+-transporting ATPase ATPase C chain
VTGIAQVVFPDAAGGSLIVRDGKPIGSTLIGQNFTDPKHFWGGPSATGTAALQRIGFGRFQPGAAEPGAGRCRQGRIDALKAADPGNREAGTGRSGHRIGQRPGPAYQPGRGPLPGAARRRRTQVVHRTRGGLIDAHTEGRRFGLFGEARVNVLLLNLALDSQTGT